MKYRLLLLMYAVFLQCMDELPPKKRFSIPQKNTDHQDPVKIAQGKLIESYREGGSEELFKKSDKLSRILQEHGISANTVFRITLKIEADCFEIFSPRNKKLETILESENVHPDTVSAVVQGVKMEIIADAIEIDHE